MVEDDEVVDFALPAEVVVEPEPEPEPLEPEEVPDEPEVPLDTEVAVPGRLTVAWAARAWKAARVLFVAGLGIVSCQFQWERRKESAHFSLITITIPF
jgi:hypothetical protein